MLLIDNDPDTANGNTSETSPSNTDNLTEDINKNETSTNLDNEKTLNSTSNDSQPEENESYVDSMDKTDVHNNAILSEDSAIKGELSPVPEPSHFTITPDVSPALQPLDASSPLYVPKHKYSEDQWSPFNKSGKKFYDLSLLKQIRDDPLSKNKPDIPILEQCNLIKTIPTFNLPVSSQTFDALCPKFLVSTGGMSRNTPRDRKDNRSVSSSGKGNVKLSPSLGGSSPQKHNVVRVSLSLREEVKLNKIENAWKPTRFKKGDINEEDSKSEELYKKFRGILNKLTPQKFDTLLEKVKTLEINNQKRLEGVIDLVFEKAIDEPNFCKAYAFMCSRLSMLKVPADNNPEQCVNFRALIISKCQAQFETKEVDEQVLKLEKDLADCVDPVKKKELHLLLEEENRRVRMRSVGNVRFIGELFKMQMLTSNIMVFCMTYLIDKVEEEKLECLCKLLTTIGEQVESKVKDNLDVIFKKLQSVVDRKKSNISSRVRFMIQDVIELRRRRWVGKGVVDLQPKMMDQIQKEAEQQHRQTEMLNAVSPQHRRDEGRGKRGDGRRQNMFIDNSNNWKTTRTSYTVDTSKLKAVSNKPLENIKLGPKSQWTQGSGTKNMNTSTPVITLPTTNKYSALEEAQNDPFPLQVNQDIPPRFQSKCASIEGTTFNLRGEYSPSGGARSGSMGPPLPSVPAPPAPPSPPLAPPAPPAPAPATPEPLKDPQESLTEEQEKLVKSIIDQCLLSPDDNEMALEFRERFSPQHHAGIVTHILNIAVEKPSKVIPVIAESVQHLVSSNTISADNFVSGLKEILEVASELYVDIPMLYNYLGMFIIPLIEKKHITLAQIFAVSDAVISMNQGHLLLKELIKGLKLSMGPSFVKRKWDESGLQLKQWMSDDQVTKFITDNKFEFLEGSKKDQVVSEQPKQPLSPAEIRCKLLQLMNSDENCDCIRGWVQDNVGDAANEDWFVRALLQAIYEHALFGKEGGALPLFNQDRMYKYIELISNYGKMTHAREANCLFGIQQLIHQLEHPQGVTLEIFQYLHEQYIISVEGFIAWEESELEPEGKGVMLKALTSFFTDIKEVDNEDSSSDESTFVNVMLSS